jgi:hypothetical protein
VAGSASAFIERDFHAYSDSDSENKTLSVCKAA